MHFKTENAAEKYYSFLQRYIMGSRILRLFVYSIEISAQRKEGIYKVKVTWSLRRFFIKISNLCKGPLKKEGEYQGRKG